LLRAVSDNSRRNLTFYRTKNIVLITIVLCRLNTNLILNVPLYVVYRVDYKSNIIIVYQHTLYLFIETT